MPALFFSGPLANRSNCSGSGRDGVCTPPFSVGCRSHTLHYVPHKQPPTKRLWVPMGPLTGPLASHIVPSEVEKESAMKWEVCEGANGLLLDGNYFIRFDGLTDVDWFRHLSDKDWVDMSALLLAFVAAYDAAGLQLDEDFFDRYKKAFFARAEDDYVVAVNDAWAKSFREDRIMVSVYDLCRPTKVCISDMIAGADYRNA